MKGYSCQCITHVGCCIKRKPRENIKVCVNVLPTSYRQVTDTLPTVGRLSADRQPIFRAKPVGRLSANCRLTNSRQSANCWLRDDQLSADCRPTVDQQSADRFFGELFFAITDDMVTYSAINSSFVIGTVTFKQNQMFLITVTFSFTKANYTSPFIYEEATTIWC